MEQFAKIAKAIDDAASAMYWPWAICILFAAALFFTFRNGFVQFRRFPEALRTMVASQQAGAGGAVSPFQAFMMGLGATIGVGNIAGVAAAIISGGPGALFWIWCYGLFATSMKFTEAVLGLKFRIARGEQTLAGPMYYLRDGLVLFPRTGLVVAALFAVELIAIVFLPDRIASPIQDKLGVPRWTVEISVGLAMWLAFLPATRSARFSTAASKKLAPSVAWLYALIAGVACLFTTPFTQPNSIAVVLDRQFKQHAVNLSTWTVGGQEISLNRLAIGLVLAALTWLVIIGGVKSIGRVLEKLSPFKVGFYMIGGLIVIVMNIAKLPAVLSVVFHDAFSLETIAGTTVGGFMGTVMGRAIRYGLARGAYANEAGYGTAAVVYGVAKSERPDQQGLNAVMEVFIITFVTSTISALTILLTGAWKLEGVESADAVAAAFNSSIPVAGGWMVAFSVFLFGYTTLMGWSFYGEQFLEYLFGARIVMPYRWVYCLLIPLGAVLKVDLVWAWGDILNGSQIFPNLIGLLALSGIAAKYATMRREPGGA
jgi:Na+/alanine symporter